MSQEKKNKTKKCYLHLVCIVGKQTKCKKHKDSSHHLQFCGKKADSRVQSELATSVCISIKHSKGYFNKCSK